jgi:Fe-S-cluster containining protein
MNELTQHYRRLRDQVDQLVGRLETIHRDAIQCKQGCTHCCVNLTVWPVEFFAIAEDLGAAGIKPVFDPTAACGFLKDGLCQIYAFRPIICRTHGLPLVYLDDEQDEPAYGVTFCEKNFQEADDSAFGPDNTLDMDAVNQALAHLQAAFVETPQTLSFARDANGRIALKLLADAARLANGT